MIMSSFEAAKEAVQRISREFGHIDDGDLETLERYDPAMRARVEQCLEAKDRLAGHAIITLAQNIYGSDARFVFELLQNADDNVFTRAIASGSTPSLSFHVYNDRIVVECNEDGFTEANLEAICAVGESSKSTSYGYIGAKGIGFKSVFIAAWKVHIQSGYFSFYFKHRRGDSGLGMIIPIWQHPNETLQDPLTRMTLYLHETNGEIHLTRLRETIFSQLSDLQETSLLFLRKVKDISVHFYDDNDNFQRSRAFHSEQIDNNRVILKTVQTSTQGDPTRSTKLFHVTRHMALNLSRSVSREDANTDAARLADSTAEVVLAFPLTENEEPLLADQDVFAFLPVRESEFKFIIQSDFDTSANRQDIVTSSQRNIDLLDAVADAFLKAVIEFCDHAGLCYTWPSFLPLIPLQPTDFWSLLTQKIQSRIPEAPILKPRHGAVLRKIGTVVLPIEDFIDANGDPLLDDSVSNPFLSGRYSSVATDALKAFGLQIMDTTLLFELLRVDLQLSMSTMKSESTTEHWHSRMAQLLEKLVNQRELQSLAFIPLSNECWVSPESGPVYLPTINGIPIPSDLDLQLLEPSAINNPDRRALYVACGAIEASVVDVRTSIKGKYPVGQLLHPPVTRQDSRAHLQFLYLTQSCEPELIRTQYMDLVVYATDDPTNPTLNPHLQDVYLPTDHPYGAERLLRPEPDLPGLQFAALNSFYLDNPPTLSDGPTWTQWLCDFVAIRARLRLVARGGNELSEHWTYVATHRPKQLLGLLEHLWEYEGPQILGNTELKKKIRSDTANDLCASPLPSPCALGGTFLPLAFLKAQCACFMEPIEAFPFLDLDTTISSEELRSKWLFLHTTFSVGIEDNLSFFLEVLFWIKEANPEASDLVRSHRIVALYAVIDAKCMSAPSDSHLDNRQFVRNMIAKDASLFVPSSDVSQATWTTASRCVWDGPPGMVLKHPLKYALTQSFEQDQVDQVSRFFQHTLQIPNANWEDIVEELEDVEINTRQDFDRIVLFYRGLASEAEASEEIQCQIRDAFASTNLIYVEENGQPGWFNTSQCLWSSTTAIRGKVTLNSHYEELRDFFVNVLGVRKLTLQMVYNELLQTDPQSSFDGVRSAIWALNGLLQSEPSNLPPEPLLRKMIFPVSCPDGTEVLMSANSDFSIGDRDYLATQFRGRIKMLNYDLAEIRQLRPLLEWMRLTNRYLSRSVRERSTAKMENVRPISSPTRDLRRKAYALVRIAATFNSPRYTANGSDLYQSLRTLSTLETDEISSFLSVFQDGHSIDIDEKEGDLHISDTADSITIFVPRDQLKQEFCFASPLQASLASWLMRDPVTQIQENVDGAMVTSLTTLLTCSPSVVDRVLDHQGVIQISIVNEDVQSPDADDDLYSVSGHSGEEAFLNQDGESSGPSDAADSAHEQDEDALVPESNDLDGDIAVPGSFPSGQDEPTPLLGGVVPIHTERATATYHERSGYRNLHFPAPSIIPEDDRQYLALLNNVVRAGRHAHFPFNNGFDMSALGRALAVESSTGFNGLESRHYSSSSSMRTFKIGAAGELYVFELLRARQPALHGWSLDNWQSKIRNYTSIHGDYAGLRAWGAPETSDLVYDDSHGDMTAMLIAHGYLDQDAWSLARPYYYIEVKTTTGPCATPFSMSKNQYQRMTDVHNRGDHSEVYMILRVFEIESEDRIGMKVYLDPEQLRLDQRSIFTGESWSIVPGAA